MPPARVSLHVLKQFQADGEETRTRVVVYAKIPRDMKREKDGNREKNECGKAS